MRSTASGGLLLFAICVAGVALQAAAGDLGSPSRSSDWTDKETQGVLSDSPWAGRGSLTNVRSGGGFSPVPDWKVTVTWRTALPIRQALVRLQIGQGGKVMADQQAVLTANEPNYIVMIDGLPAMYAGMMQAIRTADDAGARRQTADPGGAGRHGSARQGREHHRRARGRTAGGGGAPGRGGRGGVAPVKDDGSTATLMFGFPRTDPITVADKEVEFATKRNRWVG